MSNAIPFGREFEVADAVVPGPECIDCRHLGVCQRKVEDLQILRDPPGIAGPGEDPPFFAGTAPDFRGARSFYEAVYNLVVRPDGR